MRRGFGTMLAAVMLSGAAPAPPAAGASDAAAGRIEVRTVPIASGIRVRSATYTPTGRVLVSYAADDGGDGRRLSLATMEDDGRDWRPFLSVRLPDRPKDNGIRYMVFDDNRRIFLGDFIVECAPSLDRCAKSALLPVAYPPEVADGPHVARRWSEMIVAPDGRHVAWTTLLANYAAIVLVGELERGDGSYRIVRPRIVSTLDPFRPDPEHDDGVIPVRVRGGEVKQFVAGGAAISMAGSGRRDLPDSVVQDLATGRVDALTDDPGYTETTILSPDERLGVTMTARFSDRTSLAVLELVPRPYPAGLNMGLSMFAYTYAVTGVRASRPGSIGPALVDLRASRAQAGYLGRDLGSGDGWVFRSPMSWHPGSRKAMWIEGRRGTGEARIRVVDLLDYHPEPSVGSRPFPATIAGSTGDMRLVTAYAERSRALSVKVYGRRSGYITYRRTAAGVTEKTYSAFSDDGRSVWSGRERLQPDAAGRSTYVAKLTLSGPQAGRMDLKLTFGPLGGSRPASILFQPDASGAPLSDGYAEYGGRRLEVRDLEP